MDNSIRQDYPFRVWRLILPFGVIAWLSILRFCGVTIGFSLSGNIIFGIIIFAFIGLLIFVPTILIYTFVFRYLVSKKKGVKEIKLILSIIGVIGICLTFFLLWHPDSFCLH